jgi:glycosyltransferase involved in cell wall biosynthesis
MQPHISVIIPAYNAAAYVMEAIRSVQSQEYSPLEILLIDDGSDDGTADLVRAEAP